MTEKPTYVKIFHDHGHPGDGETGSVWGTNTMDKGETALLTHEVTLIPDDDGDPGNGDGNRAGSPGSSRGPRSSSLLMGWTANALVSLAGLPDRIKKILDGGIQRLRKRATPAASRGSLQYRHPLPVRVMHWNNFLCLMILLMSGLNIFDAHPALYWGKSSYSGRPPFMEIRGEHRGSGEISGVTRFLGWDFRTTGFLGASRDPDGEWTERSFPVWLTIPDWRWLAMARRWHFFFAWLFVFNGVLFVAYAIASGHLRRDLIPAKQDWSSLGRTLIDHLRLRHPTGEATRRYNILQRCAYLAVIFLLLPLMILMGLGMSPALNALHPGWVDLFAGRQSIRTIHFAIAWVLVLFLFIHVFEVIITGVWNNVRSMITGYYRIQTEREHGG